MTNQKEKEGQTEQKQNEKEKVELNKEESSVEGRRPELDQDKAMSVRVPAE